MLQRALIGSLVAVFAASVPTVAADRDGDGLRDAFETRWGATDPDRRDSDADGVIDAAEDHDGDRLSNLGEQRLGTDPNSADSDADGILDGAEDSDRDGLNNARQQDRRPVPKGLRPSLAKALGDVPPSYSNGCHSGVYESAIHPCVYGDRKGSRRVALFGDSHALQWLPALTAAADNARWRVVALTKSACPSVHVTFRESVFEGASSSCRRWRARGQAWLVRHPQHVVIISNSGRYALVDKAGKRLRFEAKEVRWMHGLARTLEAMPERSRVVVLADTPHLKQDPPPCLKAKPRDMSACVTSRSRSILRRHDLAEKATVEAAGGWFADLNDKVCPYDPCPVVIGEVLLWRNRSHLTATFARQLAPSMRSLVEGVLASSLEDKAIASPALGEPAVEPSPEPERSPVPDTSPRG